MTHHTIILPILKRFMNFGTLPQDSTAKLLQERPVFRKPAPDKNLDESCQDLGVEVYGMSTLLRYKREL